MFQSTMLKGHAGLSLELSGNIVLLSLVLYTVFDIVNGLKSLNTEKVELGLVTDQKWHLGWAIGQTKTIRSG